VSDRYVISLCDYSGVWSQPYRDAGYTVIQVDTKLGGDARLWPSKMSNEPRYSREFLDIAPYIGRTRMVLCAPVCTVFSGSGAKHRRSDDDMREALALVDACIRIATVTGSDWALENPVGKLYKWLGPKAMTFQPCDYALHADNPDSEAYTKRTLLWGQFNTDLPLGRVEPVLGSKLWRDYGGKSERTKELRSITPQGFSRAFYMANQ